jgi:hypothetical protein
LTESNELKTLTKESQLIDSIDVTSNAVTLKLDKTFIGMHLTLEDTEANVDRKTIVFPHIPKLYVNLKLDIHHLQQLDLKKLAIQ